MKETTLVFAYQALELACMQQIQKAIQLKKETETQPVHNEVKKEEEKSLNKVK